MASSADLSISTMKRLTPITAVATASLLLMGCQSKREICEGYLANPRPDGDESLEYISDTGNDLASMPRLQTPVATALKGSTRSVRQTAPRYSTPVLLVLTLAAGGVERWMDG